MASLRSILCLVTVSCCLFEGSFSFNPKHLNLSLSATHWSSAGATWYGSSDGFGSDGGSCGYGDVVSQAPFSSMVTSVGPSLYKSGKECGACYQGGTCDYSGKTIAFHVDQGSNSNYFAAVIEYEEGDGDLGSVELKDASSSDSVGDEEWRAMQQSWGAVWKLDAGSALHPPLSIKLTSQYSGQTLLAKNVIPKNWQPGATYRSVVNYL
ncbi:hypothetical protein ACLB2K_075914 [Fragaria x ananassa]